MKQKNSAKSPYFLSRFAWVACLWLGLIAPGRAVESAPAQSGMPFRDPDLPVAQRVEDLIGRLTVEEKISQLMMASPAIPRLDIPEYDWWNEALHGVARNGIATVFPQAIGFAATWNPKLIQRMADAISTEARAKNNEAIAKSGGGSKKFAGLTIWSPNINIFRDPRWGRGQETYGEDPFLTGRYAVSFVRGLQGNDPHYLKTVATVKHFAVHSGPEPLRHEFDAVVSERDLRETYLPAFETGIREGGAKSLMSAYNAVNGVPASGNKMLLTDILREEWGFRGAVVGDVDSVADIWKPKAHAYVKDAAEASAMAIKAGNDLCSGKTYEALPEALKRGLITEKELDVALRRLLVLRFQLGQFDPASRVGYRSIPISENDSPAHNQLALEVAQQSLVLLKNDGTLPWNPKDLKTVAVIGPTGNNASALLGNYNGTPSREVTLAQGIKAKLEPLGVKVLTDCSLPLVKGYHTNGQPFPKGVLFTDASRSEQGFKGEVFNNPKFEGEPIATRSDKKIDFLWHEMYPVNGIPASKASVRWSGVLVPPTSGEYILSFAAEGQVRLFVDDKLVVNGLRKPVDRTLSAPLQLNAGQTYKLRLEFTQVRPRARIQFGWRPPGPDDTMERALALAREADHIVLTLGLTPDLEGEEMTVNAEGFDGGDRKSILLPAIQRELLEKVSALKKPTVVVLTCGSAVSFDLDQANAILNCWYYGQRGADAVAGALIGESSPAGRLPITFYRDDSDLPPFSDYSMTNRTYRYFTGKPLFVFGHGLSYTTFDYQKLTLSSPTAKPDETITATVTVHNSGKRDSDEVVQLYATAIKPPVSMPLRQLIGFKRETIKAGETKTVEIAISAQLLRRWDEVEKRYVVDPGAYRIAAGPASDQAPLTAELVVGAGLLQQLATHNVVWDSPSQDTRTKPNVIIILVDDLGYGDVKCYNPERGKIPTPNIDKLASQGMRFTDAHTSSGVCSPTRYTLLTGRYHWRSRLQSYVLNYLEGPIIAPGRLTLASLLKQHGYRTGAIGKWHLGWDFQLTADERKRLQSYGGKAGGADKVKTAVTDEDLIAWRTIYARQFRGGPLTCGFDSYFGTDVPNWPPYGFIENDRTVGIPSELLAADTLRNNQADIQGPALAGWKLEDVLPALEERACAFIQNAAKAPEPFFLYLPLTAPHTPIATTKEWRGKSGLNDYADFVMQTDATVGRVLQALEESGAAQNTLVVFTSDNGIAPYVGVAELEDKGHFPSGPLRGYKGDAWEGGHRVPFIVRWPGKVKPDTRCDALVMQADLMATLAETLNAKLPDNAGEDSFSLLPLLQGGNKPMREYAISHGMNGLPALRKGSLKIIFGQKGGGFTNAPGTTATGQLYDLATDLGETKNLWKEQPELVAELTATMTRLVADGRSTPGEKQQNDVPVRWQRFLERSSPAK